MSRLIRVALEVEPTMLRSLLIELISVDPEVEVIESSPVVPPDVWVVAHAGAEEEAAPTATLRRAPLSRVLTLESQGRRAFLWELRPFRTALGELSRESLLAAIHGAPLESR